MLNLIKYTHQEIYKEILSRVDYEDLYKIISKNRILQLKCKVFKVARQNCPRDIIVKGILDLYKTNYDLEKFILDTWKENILDGEVQIDELKKKDKIVKYLDCIVDLEEKFELATVLWLKNSKELNEIGDIYYEKYLEEKKLKDITGEEAMDLLEFTDKNNSLLNIKLGDIITQAQSYKEKYELLETKESKNNEIIKDLNNKLLEANKLNKEKDKVIKDLNQKFGKLENEIQQKFKVVEELIKNCLTQMSNLDKNINEDKKDIKKKFDDMSGANAKLSEQIKSSNQSYLKSINSLEDNISNKLEELLKRNCNAKENNEDSEEEIKIDKPVYSVIKESVRPDPDVEKMLEGLSDLFDKN